MLSRYPSPSYVLELLEGGSDRRAYLLKERVSDVTQLVAAITTSSPRAGLCWIRGRRGARRRERAKRGVAAQPADAARARRAPRDGRGKDDAAIAGSLVLTERSVEKVIHSIFLKLGLTWEPAVHKRVKAVILFLAESA